MAVQILSIIKAVAPYLAQIATATIPAFTSRTEAVKSDPVVAKQIEELQTAVTQNAQSIHLLAEKLQLAMQGVESAALESKQQLAAYKALVFASFSLSLIAFLISAYLLVR